MNDSIKYSESRIVSPVELEQRPGLPSQILREMEADLIGRLARSVALSGRRFIDWPDVRLISDTADVRYYRDNTMRLVATVVVK